MYDYMLGGHNNRPADREVVDALLAVAPATKATVIENRRFLGRAVKFLAEQGVRQFLDIGAGLPTQDNVHQIAQRAAPDARVVYVDNDPEVVVYGRELLSGDSSVAIAEGDIRRPADILGLAEVRGLLDLSQPVALMMFAVLYFIADDEEPWRMVARLRDALAPGSYLALSHATADDLPAEQVAAGVKVYNRASGVTLRTWSQIERFTEGFDLFEPGLVLASAWRPDGPLPAPDEVPAMYGAVGRLAEP
jgi:SAM-dependent methyltransferase